MSIIERHVLGGPRTLGKGKQFKFVLLGPCARDASGLVIQVVDTNDHSEIRAFRGNGKESGKVDLSDESNRYFCVV